MHGPVYGFVGAFDNHSQPGDANQCLSDYYGFINYNGTRGNHYGHGHGTDRTFGV